MYISKHTKKGSSCKQSSTAVKPSNHIETPLKTPIPNIRSISPQTIQALEEKTPIPTPNSLINFLLLLFFFLFYSLFLLFSFTVHCKRRKTRNPNHPH
jgi:hypothetical protein